MRWVAAGGINIAAMRNLPTGLCLMAGVLSVTACRTSVTPARADDWPSPTAAESATPSTTKAPQDPEPAPVAASTSPTSNSIVPLPSVLDFTGGAGFGLAVGIGVEYEGAYDGADEYEFAVEPAGAVHWRRGDSLLFWEGIEAGWRFLATERTLLQLSARYEGGREASDSDDGRLAGLRDQDSHIVGSVEVRQGLDAEWRNWIGGKALVGESDFGVLGIVAAGHRFGSAVDGTGSELFGYASFGDSAFLDKDFGITADEALSSGLRQTQLSGGFRAAGLTFVHRRTLWHRLHLIAQANVEFYGDEVRQSPIARDDFEAEASVALVWIF
jgi:outer membrane protein